MSPFRDWYPGGLSPPALGADEWTEACASSAKGTLELQQGAGATWMLAGVIYTEFTAAAPPNSSVPDCGTSGVVPGPGLFTARSYHPNGVNASMVDGSVRWFPSTTQKGVWRNLGTRSGDQGY